MNHDHISQIVQCFRSLAKEKFEGFLFGVIFCLETPICSSWKFHFLLIFVANLHVHYMCINDVLQKPSKGIIPHSSIWILSLFRKTIWNLTHLKQPLSTGTTTWVDRLQKSSLPKAKWATSTLLWHRSHYTYITNKKLRNIILSTGPMVRLRQNIISICSHIF